MSWTPRMDQEMQARRRTVRTAMAVLPLLEKAAREASRQRRELDAIHRRHRIYNEHTAWTVLLLEREHKAQLAREWRDEDRKHRRLNLLRWTFPASEPSRRHKTQEELRAIARTKHWSQVVWESGTDRIVRILP